MSAVARTQWARLIVLVAAALMIRAQTLGHPLLHMDENFYLLVGDRMVSEGAWPYVTIWDRKPAGLFILFAGFRLLGGDGILAYQCAALLAVISTAWIIMRLADRVVRPVAALAGGVAYCAGLTFFGGYGGQAPVFFNLLMAAAAFILVRDLIAPAEQAPKRVLASGIKCMFLVGMALQIKYSVVFEGIFFGLLLLLAARTAGLAQMMLYAPLWIGAALLPTIIAWVVFAAAGHHDAFVHANFISIFERTSSFDATAQKRLFSLLGLLAPLVLFSLPAWRARSNPTARFALTWLGVAFAALFIMGTYYNHYGLPMLLPLSLTFALGVGQLGWSKRALGVVIMIAIMAGGFATAVKLARKGDAGDIVHILTYLPPGKAPCPWFMGTLGATLYLKSGACLPTRYPLSGHLFERHEAKAIGADQNAEIRAILAQRPPVITLDQTPRPEEDKAQRARFLDAISRDYHLAEIRETGKSDVMIYVRIAQP